MKHLIITLSIAFNVTFTSLSAFANTDCDFMTDSVFVCYFEGTTGLEIFENLDDLQITKSETSDDGRLIVDVLAPELIGHDLDIKNCISVVLPGEVMTTCFLNTTTDQLGFSTARPVPQKLSTARPAPQKTVKKRIDVR